MSNITRNPIHPDHLTFIVNEFMGTNATVEQLVEINTDPEQGFFWDRHQEEPIFLTDVDFERLVRALCAADPEFAESVIHSSDLVVDPSNLATNFDAVDDMPADALCTITLHNVDPQRAVLILEHLATMRLTKNASALHVTTSQNCFHG